MSEETAPAQVKAKATKAEAAPKRPRPDDKLAKRRAERKKRGVTDHGFDKRLAVDETTLDTENYTYRWAVDRPGRIKRLEDREYEVVDPSDLEGQEVARHGGTDAQGNAMQTVLMRKWKPWYEEDRAERVKAAREQDAALMQGKSPALNEDGGGADYASPGNSISAAEVS